MQATFYPNAYPGCADSSASGQQYGLPDLGSLAPDAILPNRCQDPGTLQVRPRDLNRASRSRAPDANPPIFC